MSAIVGRYSKGDRYQVTEGFSAHVLTMWKAFTGGYERSSRLASSLSLLSSLPLDAEPFSEWEALVVDAADRADPKYNGCDLSIPFEYVEKLRAQLP